MSTLSLFFVILWCIAKPVLFVVIPTLLIGELVMFGSKHFSSRGRVAGANMY